MTDTEQQLLQVVKEKALHLAAPGQKFKLASGGESDYYIDSKMAVLSSRGAFLIGEVLYERTRDLNIDALGGLEVGAIPLSAAAAISYQIHGRTLEGFIVRDRTKGHGTRKAIEGDLRPGARVVIVDDVVTRGESAAKAIRAVQEIGCTVVQVITIVDRAAGAAELFRELGVADYRPVFTLRDLGVTTGQGG